MHTKLTLIQLDIFENVGLIVFEHNTTPIESTECIECLSVCVLLFNSGKCNASNCDCFISIAWHLIPKVDKTPVLILIQWFRLLKLISKCTFYTHLSINHIIHTFQPLPSINMTVQCYNVPSICGYVCDGYVAGGFGSFHLVNAQYARAHSIVQFDLFHLFLGVCVYVQYSSCTKRLVSIFISLKYVAAFSNFYVYLQFYLIYQHGCELCFNAHLTVT